jgi:hypothetical protein
VSTEWMINGNADSGSAIGPATQPSLKMTTSASLQRDGHNQLPRAHYGVRLALARHKRSGSLPNMNVYLVSRYRPVAGAQIGLFCNRSLVMWVYLIRGPPLTPFNRESWWQCPAARPRQLRHFGPVSSRRTP